MVVGLKIFPRRVTEKTGEKGLEGVVCAVSFLLGRDVFCALFVGLDVADLAAVGTLALGSSGFASAWGSAVRRLSCRGSGGSLLLLASEAPFFVAVKAVKFGLEPRHHTHHTLVFLRQTGRRGRGGSR